MSDYAQFFFLFVFHFKEINSWKDKMAQVTIVTLSVFGRKEIS